MKYLVTLEFPAPDCCRQGAVRFVEVYADNVEDAKHKAILSVTHIIKTNRVVRLDDEFKPNDEFKGGCKPPSGTSCSANNGGDK